MYELSYLIQVVWLVCARVRVILKAYNKIKAREKNTSTIQMISSTVNQDHTCGRMSEKNRLGIHQQLWTNYNANASIAAAALRSSAGHWSFWKPHSTL